MAMAREFESDHTGRRDVVCVHVRGPVRRFSPRRDDLRYTAEALSSADNPVTTLRWTRLAPFEGWHFASIGTDARNWFRIAGGCTREISHQQFSLIALPVVDILIAKEKAIVAT